MRDLVVFGDACDVTLKWKQVTGTPKADLPRAMTFVKFMEWEFSERERNSSTTRGSRCAPVLFTVGIVAFLVADFVRLLWSLLSFCVVGAVVGAVVLFCLCCRFCCC